MVCGAALTRLRQHAREMGSDPTREPPFFFCKPADAVVPVPAGARVALPFPSATANLHFEVEQARRRSREVHTHEAAPASG
jgi:2-keto-4-pentenoate hydratase/2-oxohepta-3-ene-1,7-dioic acid hydratase in catechol pathway